MSKGDLKIAIVHEYIQKFGGAERTLSVLAEMFPQAQIFTLLYNKKTVGDIMGLDTQRITASNLQRLPGFIRKKHGLLAGRFQKAIEEFDLSDFDVVISSSNSFAHGVVTKMETQHICYYHSPTRYIWDWTNEYVDEIGLGKLRRFLAKKLFLKMRIWDKLASDRPDILVANSKTVQKRIKKYYKKDSILIYPPIDVERFKLREKAEVQDFFLIVSTLSEYKKINLAVEFFNKVGKKLIIVGEGGQKSYLESIAGPSVEIKGRLNDKEVTELMETCRGFIFPGEEDFGMTPVEVMAAGRPIFALRRGGLTESMIDKKTGMFFEEPTLESFEKGFAKFLSFEKKYFNPKDSRKRAQRYSVEQFEKSIKALIGS